MSKTVHAAGKGVQQNAILTGRELSSFGWDGILIICRYSFLKWIILCILRMVLLVIHAFSKRTCLFMQVRLIKGSRFLKVMSGCPISVSENLLRSYQAVSQRRKV